MVCMSMGQSRSANDQGKTYRVLSATEAKPRARPVKDRSARLWCTRAVDRARNAIAKCSANVSSDSDTNTRRSNLYENLRSHDLHPLTPRAVGQK